MVEGLSQQLAARVESTAPAVVRVEARPGSGASGVVWSTGVVLAADHSVQRDEGIPIGVANGDTLRANVAGRDPGLDLAVLQLSSGTTPEAAAWSTGEDLRVGHLVLAVARPGRSVRASLGIVSAVGDAWRTPAGGKIARFLQADIGLHAGYSGSVLVDLAGRALGMNTAGLLRGSGVTIPTATLQKVVGDLLTHGAPRRGFLGIGAIPVRVPEQLQRTGAAARALLVVSVQPNSPAERAGVLLGDVLVALGQHPVAEVQDLLEALESQPAGTPSVAHLLRGGEPRALEITPGTREE